MHLSGKVLLVSDNPKYGKVQPATFLTENLDEKEQRARKISEEIRIETMNAAKLLDQFQTLDKEQTSKTKQRRLSEHPLYNHGGIGNLETPMARRYLDKIKSKNLKKLMP